jgi:hypothetical protein
MIWTSKPCNLQSLPRPRTLEYLRVRRAVECLLAEAHAEGCDLWAMNYWPLRLPTTANQLVREGVRKAIESNQGSK